MNEFLFDDIPIGFEQNFSRHIDINMETVFRQLSGDENPLHRDDVFANTVSGGKFRKHVSYGMMTASLYSTLAGVYIPGKYSLIHSIDKLSFFYPVYAGDNLTVYGKVIDKNEALKLLFIKAKIINQDGKKVSSAEMKVYVLK